MDAPTIIKDGACGKGRFIDFAPLTLNIQFQLALLLKALEMNMASRANVPSRNLTRRFLFLGAFFLVASNSAWRCFAADPSFAEGAAQRLSDAVKGDTPGLAVLVARDGEILFQGGYGLADMEKKSPITPETKFRIGSISKQFTAVAVLQLAEQGKLSLDDSLAKYFPDFPGGDKVNLRQLLTHTSGLHSYTDKPEFIGRVKQPIEPAELIAWFQNDKPDFAPGEGFHYNNSAYFLLGEIVAKVSGKSFGDHLKATIFDPLEMSNTGIYVNSAAPSGMASSYSFVNDKFEPALDWDMSWAGGAGAIYSTVGDLYRWNEALFGGRVLSDASLKAATTPVELPPNVDGMNYGYGLMMLNVKRLPAVGHGGGLNGWSTYLVRLPEQKCTVVVLANALPLPSGAFPERHRAWLGGDDFWPMKSKSCRRSPRTSRSIRRRSPTTSAGSTIRVRS